MSKLFVLYPAGEQVSEEFLRRLRTSIPTDAEVLPVSGTPPRGLADLLLQGYETAPSDRCVVRLDTAEHPPEAIPRLVAEVERTGGMAIGQLIFDKGLVRGSPEEFAHCIMFPLLYGGFTQGRLRLNCAHGFQAFAPGVIKVILPFVRSIVTGAESILGVPVKWGLDGAVSLAALHKNIPISVLPVQAEVGRNRPAQKVAQQTLSAALMLASWTRLTTYE